MATPVTTEAPVSFNCWEFKRQPISYSYRARIEQKVREISSPPARQYNGLSGSAQISSGSMQLCVTAKSMPIASRAAATTRSDSTASTARVTGAIKHNVIAGEFPYKDPRQAPCPSPYLKRLWELSDLEQSTYQRDTICYAGSTYRQQKQQATRLSRPSSSHGRIDSSKVRTAASKNGQSEAVVTKPARTGSTKRSLSVTCLPVNKSAAGGAVKPSHSDTTLSSMASYNTKQRLKRAT